MGKCRRLVVVLPLLVLLQLLCSLSSCQGWGKAPRRRLSASLSHRRLREDDSSSSGTSTGFPVPLEQVCRSSSDSNTNTTRSICDLPNTFGTTYRQYLQDLIDHLEDSYTVICNGQPVDMEIGVFIERRDIHYGEGGFPYPSRFHLSPRREGDDDNGPDGQQIAAEIHQKWGLGSSTECGNSGMLFYLALQKDGGDRYRHGKLFVSRGEALSQVVPDQVLQNLHSGTLPYLQQLKYGAAIQYAVTFLTAYMNGDQAEEAMEHEQNVVMALGVLVLLLYFLKCYILRRALMGGQSIGARCANALARNQRKDIEKKLQEVCHTTECTYQAEVEGRSIYMPGRCPICLGPFPDDFPNYKPVESRVCIQESKTSCSESTPLMRPASSGTSIKPLLILPCGHVYDYSCILDWFVHQRSKHAKPTCPICLHDLKFYP